MSERPTKPDTRAQLYDPEPEQQRYELVAGRDDLRACDEVMPDRWTLSPGRRTRPVDPWLVEQSSTD